MPKFSVVISVFNKEKYISDTLKSVLAQTFQDFEIVILNDGSTDNSEAEILKFKDKRIRYFHEANQGAGAARNFVIEKAEGEFIALLDADDFWKPQYLTEIDKLITSFPEGKVFATAIELETKGKTFPSTYSLPDLTPGEVRVVDYFSASFLNTILTSSSTVLHHSVFEKAGKYDPSIKSGEDTDFWIRIGLHFKVIFLNTPYATYRYDAASLSNTKLKVKEYANFDRYEKFEADNHPLKKFLDLNRYSLCVLAKIEGNKEAFQKNLEKIDLENLSKKQRFILQQNKTIVKYLSKTKDSLARLGLRLSTFK